MNQIFKNLLLIVFTFIPLSSFVYGQNVHYDKFLGQSLEEIKEYLNNTKYNVQIENSKTEISISYEDKDKTLQHVIYEFSKDVNEKVNCTKITILIKIKNEIDESKYSNMVIDMYYKGYENLKTKKDFEFDRVYKYLKDENHKHHTNPHTIEFISEKVNSTDNKEADDIYNGFIYSKI